jgi:hypothetical protein
VRAALIVGVCVTLGIAVVTMLWAGRAAARPAREAAPGAGRSSCYPVPPATAPPAQCLVMTDPDAAGLAIWGVPGGPSGGTPETEWLDYLGQPIATMGQAGGLKVFGDQACVYPPGNVFVPAACLRDDATISVGGQLLSASDIAWLHAARAAGPGATAGCPSRPPSTAP